MLCERHFNHVRRRFISVGTWPRLPASLARGLRRPPSPVPAIFLTLAGFFLYSGLGPFWSVPMDVVAPHEVGLWLGFINMGTQLAGFLGPIVIGC